MMMCKFEHDGDCCNCGSPQYMCKCKPNICGSVVPITNADHIRAMSDEELAVFLAEEQHRIANIIFQAVGYGLEKQVICARRLDWLQQPAEEDT